MNNYKKRTEYKSTTPLVDRAFRHLSKLPILSTINTWSKEYPVLRQVPLTLVHAMDHLVVKNKITKNLDRIWSDASRLRPLLYETPNRLSTWQRVQQAALVLLLSVP